MNEIIEELWKHFMCNPLVDGGYTKKDGFKQAIQTACKAQRNACAREFRRYSMVHEYTISNNWARAISMSKIERCDYE